ncbi:MAG: branched-chain amino acid ABC transporter permease, partial [Nitrospira sp.]|nr:branched-chain amino acid ABC transporter permease [Nitrospira sp.]
GMAMVSTFIAFVLLDQYQVPFAVAILLTLVFAFLLGVALELFFLRPAKTPTLLGSIVITLGCELILYGFAGWKWGADQRSFPFPVLSTQVYTSQGVVMSQLSLWTFLLCFLLMGILFLFLRYSRLGLAMKATQQSLLAARVVGIRTRRVLSLTWGLSSVVGAVAGILIAPVYTLDPNMMLDPVLKGFAAAVLGGMTSLPGAIVGGYLLGVLENLFGGYISLEFKSVVAFAVIVLVLCIKPSGLLATHYVKKV